MRVQLVLVQHVLPQLVQVQHVLPQLVLVKHLLLHLLLLELVVKTTTRAVKVDLRFLLVKALEVIILLVVKMEVRL